MSAIETEQPRRSTQGIVLAVFLFLLTIGSIWLFTQRYWWMPSLASAHGGAIDRMFGLTLAITGVLFVVLQVFLAVLIARFRNRGADTTSRAVRPRVEYRFAWIAGILILSVDVTVFAMGESQWFMAWGKAPADSVLVEVNATQFMWHFRYPGKDGVFGQTNRSLVTVDNPIGLDPADPASKDDVISANELHLAGKQPVRLRLRSKDVIHSFYLPNFRVKQDVVPEMAIELWFVPTQDGRFEIACNQLCGLFHHRMRGFVVVEPREKVDAWLTEMAEQGE